MTTTDNNKPKSLTRAEIATVLSSDTSVLKKDASKTVDSIIDSIHGAISIGEDVKIAGFGKFFVKSKTARIGRNPKTGESVPIPARKVLRFHPSDSLKTVLNGSLP